jgi:hypothetical protein
VTDGRDRGARSPAPSTDVVEIHLRLPPDAIAYVKFVFESYEGIAVLRTVDRRTAVIVLLVAPDFVHEAWRILESLHAEVPWQRVSAPASAE